MHKYENLINLIISMQNAFVQRIAGTDLMHHHMHTSNMHFPASNIYTFVCK